MTSETETPTSPAPKTAPPQPARAPGGRQEKSAGSRAGLVLKAAFNLLLTSGIVAAGYLVYEQDKAIEILYQQQNEFVQSRDAAQARVDRLQQAVTTLQAAVASAEQMSRDQLAALNTEVQRLQGELVSARLRINSPAGASGQELMLSEAESLLRLGEQHLVTAGNARTALALFVAADDILRQVDDPAIYAVRNTLAGELAALRAVPDIDVQGLYLRLGGLLTQLDSLEYDARLAEQLASGETVNPVNGEAGGEAGMLDTLRNAVNRYVVIRRRDAPIQAMLSPEQVFSLKQGIRLQIEQAKVALLRGQQEIYRSGLVDARRNIDTYLGGDAAVKQALLAALDDLADTRITASLPPVAGARTALGGILRTRSEPGDGAATR